MIYIRKNGIFYENSYSTEVDNYIFTKVESFIPYLNEVIYIDNEVTLEDVFSIFEKDEDIINILFGSHMGHYPLRPYIDEIKKDCLAESREDLEYIECSWHVEQFDYKKFYKKHKDKKTLNDIFGPLEKPNGEEVNEISIDVNVHGWGKYKLNGNETKKDIPTHMSYAIEFIPLYRIKHASIRLNKRFIIRKATYDTYDNKQPVIVDGEYDFTVLDIFGALLTELTFAGLPEDRDEKWKEVVDSIEEYRDQMEEESEEDEENEEEETNL